MNELVSINEEELASGFGDEERDRQEFWFGSLQSLS